MTLLPGPGVWAMKGSAPIDAQAVQFAATTAGIQAAIDYLGGSYGKVYLGPGLFSLTSVIYVHGNCTIEGSGQDVTILQRAAGSLTSGDAAYTGCMFFATPYGSISPPGSSNSLTDITIRDLTMDGNYTVFGAVNPSTPRHMAIYFFWCAEVRIHNCEIKNFLQTGISLDSCKNSVLAHLRLTTNGQYASPSSRNSIGILTTDAAAIGAGFATNFTVDDIISTSPKDEHLGIANCNNVAVSNMVCTGGDIVLELEGDTTRTTAMSGFSYVNVRATGNTGAFFTNNLSNGVSLGDVNISNCSMTAHATLHATPAIVVSQATGTTPVTRFVVDNCIFSNINSADISGIHMVNIAGSSASSYIIFRGCIFTGGASASTRTDCHGLRLASPVSRLMVDSCTFTTVAGVGVFISPGSGMTVSDSFIRDVFCDTTNNDAFQFVENSSTNGIIKNLTVSGCGSKDCDRQTGNQCFKVGAASGSGGGSVSYVSLTNCYGYKNSGGNPARGIDVVVGAGSTTDNISAVGCNFNNLIAPFNNSSGTPTNLHFVCPQGKGTAIASAATITIPTDGDTFHVTGAVNVTNGITVKPWDNGRFITLIFDSTPTVSDTGTSVLNGAFVATADDTLSLRCDATNWYECGRSPN